MKIICSFKFFKYFLILFLFIPVFLFSEGFFSGTLVKSEFGSIPIEQLQVGDKVFVFDKNGFHLGSLDPRTKELYRSADCSRRLVI